MRLLLDEHLPAEIAIALRADGHDVVAIQERSEWRRMPDDDVLTLARAQRRAVVTNNVRDFRPRAAQAILEGHGHPGLVLLAATYRRRRADIGRLVTALDALLRDHPEPEGLADREAWL